MKLVIEYKISGKKDAIEKPSMGDTLTQCHPDGFWTLFHNFCYNNFTTVKFRRSNNEDNNFH
jgi:hypothetical protein